MRKEEDELMQLLFLHLAKKIQATGNYPKSQGMYAVNAFLIALLTMIT